MRAVVIEADVGRGKYTIRNREGLFDLLHFPATLSQILKTRDVRAVAFKGKTRISLDLAFLANGNTTVFRSCSQLGETVLSHATLLIDSIECSKSWDDWD